MIKGIGTDIIEIDRINKVNKKDKLAQRILSDEEYSKYCNLADDGRKNEFLAGRFAVKEAYSKALGSGIGSSISFKDINCVNDVSGRPYLVNDTAAHVSISHSKNYAVATVILEVN